MGSVKIDGEDVRRFTLKSLRDQISFVLQEPILFRTTVSENIACGKSGATRQEVVRAAHRLATVRKADVIYVLEDGRIAEAGKHQELLARGGLYSPLYDIQFKNQEVEPVIDDLASTVH